MNLVSAFGALDRVYDNSELYFNQTYRNKVFVQDEIGNGSIHFESLNNTFINYINCNETNPDWILDNNQKFPPKVFFKNTSVDKFGHFRGIINWKEDFNTTYKNEDQWQYKFRIMEQGILSGAVYSISGDKVVDMEPIGFLGIHLIDVSVNDWFGYGSNLSLEEYMPGNL